MELDVRIWKQVALCIAVATVGAGSLCVYRSIAKHRDLRETVLWMDQTYNRHDGGENYGLGHGNETHYLENSSLHTEDVTEEFRETFAYKGDCNIVLHHETVPIGVFKTVYTNYDDSLSLCDVDPDSIKISKFDFHKDVFNCSDPEEVELYNLNCNSAEIEFHMRNGVPKIKENSLSTYAELTGKDHNAESHNQQSKEWFIVDDVTYAERFAKAFRHAVELCGGKASKF
jgi:hypothetical protein